MKLSNDDHLKAVGRRWRRRYAESGMSKAEFAELTRTTMTGYGWTDAEAACIAAIATAQ